MRAAAPRSSSVISRVPCAWLMLEPMLEKTVTTPYIINSVSAVAIIISTSV